MKREPIRWPTQWVVQCISALAVVCVVSIVLVSPAQAQTLSNATIPDNSVTTDALDSGDPAANPVRTPAVTAAKIADGAITADKIDSSSTGLRLNGDELDRIIREKSLTGADLDNTFYGEASFVANTVLVSDKLATGAVGSVDIADDAVTSEDILDRDLGTFHIADGAVTADKLASAADFAIELQRDLEAGLDFIDAQQVTRSTTYTAEGDDTAIVEAIVASVKAGLTLDITGHADFDSLGVSAKSALVKAVTREVAVRYQIGNTADSIDITGATEEARKAEYRAGSLRGQAGYLADRIGLDPDEAGSNDADATLTARLNYAADIVEGNQGLLEDTLPDAGAAPTTAIASQDVFDAVNAVAKYRYLADRIGLESDETSSATGTVQARVNDLKERIGSSDDTIADPATDYDGASTYARSNYWKDRVDGAQAETISLLAAFGERTDQIAGYEDSAALNSELTDAAYEGASVGARANYLADRIGLNSGAAGSRTGTLTEQTNYLREKTGSDNDIIAGLTAGNVESVSQSDYRDATVHARANYLADRIGLDPNVEGDKTGSLTARLNYLDDEIGGDEDQIMVPAGMDPDGNPITDVNGNPVLTAISGDDVNDGTDGSRANALDLDTLLGNNLNARANWFAARVGLNRDVAGKRNGNLQAQNNWVSDEIGRSADAFRNYTGFAASQNAIDIADYQNSTVRQQHNYWRDRIGLDPDALPNRYGRVQEQVNWLIDQADRIQRAAAMTGSLRDAHIPPGHRGGASFTFADYDGEIGYSMSLASIMGTRSKMTMSFASTENTEESLFRFGYDISW